jgi:ornithine cyclodeaminase/alanine dehydrogenase-like protein (mu-crystallin family)
MVAMTKKIEVLFLSESDCSSTGLTMKEIIEFIEELFKAHGEGNVFVSAKSSLDMELFSEFKTLGNVMPAYFPSWKIYGIK